MGVKYTPIAEYFPVKDLDLWSRDGVHLSDSVGMPILSKTAKESKDGAEAEGSCLQEDPGNATGGGSAHGCGGDITATYQ
ncbi:hypothetical protein CesoFtcFv8_004463 [Champsocephalus esox]|uniref:Uncharacterized protein n=1 Tax=Champsocephalus esox TaxID=159716 RepID=A0AAN8CSZ1_9TELE|nr:hypothetical protein CesoFtcFv8_004463 [Champsocephalus esox]